jgi:hypothetical protein
LEPPALTAVFSGRKGQFAEYVISGSRVLDCGNEFKVTAVGGGKQFPKSRQTVDGLLHCSPFGFFAAIAMFYLSVVFEKGNVVDGGPVEVGPCL